MEGFRPRRLVLLAAGMATLFLALIGGLARMGWNLPARPDWVVLHGPLLMGGFFGTVIGLERAVALQSRLAWGVPLLTAAGSILALTGKAQTVAAAMWVAASLGLIGVFVVLLRRQPTLFMATMAGGAVLWAVGNLTWLLGFPIPHIVWWWAGFLVLTIMGERLELNRLLQPTPLTRAWFVGAMLLFTISVAAAMRLPDALRITGVSLLLMAAWLARWDIARRTIRGRNLTRFIALCLLSGYVWLAVSGLILLFGRPQIAGPLYDAGLHALFLGFVFGMIFGHAPVIFPSILGARYVFSRRHYLHLALLQASLLLRIGGGVLGVDAWRTWGALFNGLSITLFVLVTVTSMRFAKARHRVDEAATATR